MRKQLQFIRLPIERMEKAPIYSVMEQTRGRSGLAGLRSRNIARPTLSPLTNSDFSKNWIRLKVTDYRPIQTLFYNADVMARGCGQIAIPHPPRVTSQCNSTKLAHDHLVMLTSVWYGIAELCVISALTMAQLRLRIPPATESGPRPEPASLNPQAG